MQPSRRLVLVRHAQAAQSAQIDEQRTLTTAGRGAAAAAGAWLTRTGVTPDCALVSAAVRAVQTWEELAAGGGWDLAAEATHGLYVAEPASVLDLVREVPADTTCLVLVGHNPTMASLAQTLDDGEGDPEAQQRLLTGGFPPGAVAVFEYDGTWADLDLATARLVAVHS